MKTTHVLPNLAAMLSLSVAGFTGCSNPPHHPNPPAHPSAACTIKDENGHPIPAHFTGTLGTTHRSHAATHVVLVQSLETGCCEQFDRLVFNIEGFHQPTYTVKYANPPFSQCGPGTNVSTPGHAWLQIKFNVAQAHTDAGQATVPNRIRTHCPNLRQIDELCDFESDVQFVVSLNTKKPYRVVELQDPTRLVIDIKH